MMPETMSARGMVRRAFLISSLMKEPVSQPPNEKKIVDQKMAFFRSGFGVIVAAVNLVAEPYRETLAAASTSRIMIGSQLPNAPRLLSHFPNFRPRTLSIVMSVRQAKENSK